MSDRDLTTGPVHRALLAVSGPMSFGILAVLSVGVADAYFLGQTGAAALAAVGFIYPVTTALTSLAIGLSAGTNAAVSQSIGREDAGEETRRLGVHAIGFGLLLSLALALAVWLLHPPLFSMLGAREAAMAEIALYMPWWSLSFPFLVLMMITNAVFRAHGDGVTSALLMILAAVVNVGLDPLLIFGLGPLPEFGTAGAAMATLAGRAAAASLALWLAWRRGYLALCASPLRGLGASARSIFAVGLPAAFSNAINPAGMALVTAAVATLGEAAVGGFGAATRVQSLVIVPMLALSAGIGPVVGQNVGAEKPERARLALRQSWAFCAGYGLAAGLCLWLGADMLAAWLASGGESAEHAARYLSVVGWSLAGYGILVTTNAALNAQNDAVQSMALSLGRIGALYLPLAWLGVTLMGFGGILAAAVAANLVIIPAALWMARRCGLWQGSLRLVPRLA